MDKIRGLSLRDYFAGQALIGFLNIANIVSKSASEEGKDRTKYLASACYEIADTMIKERERK